MENVYEFESRIDFDRDISDGYMKHFVALPEDVSISLLSLGVSRFEGTIDDRPFRRTLHQQEDGSVRLRFGKAWLRDRELEFGTVVRVTIGPDLDPDRVDIPIELEDELNSQNAMKIWEALTPGKKRTLVYAIERAKRTETKIKRAKETVKSIVDS